MIYKLAAQQLTLAHYWADNVTHPMLINVFIQVSTYRSQGVWIPKPGQAPSGVWTRNLSIYQQCLNPLEDSAQVRVIKIIWFIVALFWNFLTFSNETPIIYNNTYFKLGSSRHKSVLRVSILLKKALLKNHRYISLKMSLFSKFCNRS